MPYSKYRVYFRRKCKTELDVNRNGLKKENANMKKTLLELSRQHSEHYKLVERFLLLEAERLKSSQQLIDTDKKATSSSEELSKKWMDVLKMRVSVYTKEIEDVKNKLVKVATKCQRIESQATVKKDSGSDDQTSNTTIAEVHDQLRDVLEKDKQWLEYDQQREAYLRAIMGRMLWLEEQLNEANQARSQQHNEDHSDEKRRMREMQEHYERILQKAEDELQVLREKLDITNQTLQTTQKWCKEKETEVEKIKQQLLAQKTNRKNESDDLHSSEDGEQRQRHETEELRFRLDKERRRSANFELQSNFLQKFLLNRHEEDQEKIAGLERQIKVYSQDLEDERQNCLYLKEETFRALKMLKKTKGRAKHSKADQQDFNTCEAARPHSQLSRNSHGSTVFNSPLNESFLECPGCQAQYPAIHYRELMNHLEICLE